jgi:hypothetical protein
VIGLGLLAVPFVQRFWPYGQFDATVQALKDRFTRLPTRRQPQSHWSEAATERERCAPRKTVAPLFGLGDGSLIEMKDRSELYLTKQARTQRFTSTRGSIVVEAAKAERRAVVC